MKIYFLSLFVGSLLSSYLTLFASFKWLLPKQIKLKLNDYKKRIVPNLETHLLEKFNLGEIPEMNDLIEAFLTKFMEGLKSQIPMGHILFSPSLTLKIKSYALAEITKEMPFVKDALIDYLKTNKPYEGVLLENIDKIHDETIEEGYRLLWKALFVSLFSTFFVTLTLTVLISYFL